MDAKTIIKELSNHYLMKSDVSMQMQLGLPYLEKRNEKLYVSFKPHREIYGKEKVDIYEKMYIVEWEYPFKHVTLFKDLSSEKKIAEKPVCTIKAEDFMIKGKYLYNELYDECSRVLSFMEKDNKVSDLVIGKYQDLYHNTINELGLGAVYGEN